MSEPREQDTLGEVDLSDYADKIISAEDHPLFDDAVEAGKVGALRAAYVMIWLACAESLKRRFREARKRDHTAGRIIGEIESKESEHKAVDKLVLAKAHEYGFISESAHTVLEHVSEMRCVYGHPYEEAPSKEQVLHAAAVVVENVLSKPVKLRHGFGKQLLKNLLEDPNYLDDQKNAVETFTKDIIPKIDEGIYGWLLEKYWEELEEIADDSSMFVFFRRGICFSRTMLIEVGVNVFSCDDWHDKTGVTPKALIRVCSDTDIFREIGKRAQDSLVGVILTESNTRAHVLSYLEQLYYSDALTKRQTERFLKQIPRMEISEIRSAGLKTLTCYKQLIEAMKSRNWYTQNPAIDLVVANGPAQAAELEEEQQVDLGRNILQCAQGTEKSACKFLEELPKNGTSWPFDVLRGIALESFTNEDNQIRFKKRHLYQVLSALNCLKVRQRDRIMSEITESVEKGTPKDSKFRDDLKQTIEVLEQFKWTEKLRKSLNSKAVSLQDEEEDE